MPNLKITEKIQQLQLDTPAAQKWASEGRLEAWAHHYLNNGLGGTTNPAFSKSLKNAPRWWHGPLKLPLTTLSPAVGTAPEMEYVVNQSDWHAWTSRLAQTFTTPEALPPLILEYRDGELSIRDGNTRFGAMQLLGWQSCWVIIWYNTQQDFDQHKSNAFST